jgi:hypothetical protein
MMAELMFPQIHERIRFFTGQRLYASDIQSVEEYNRRMRWLHNQSLHQPGVGSGFAVTAEIGDREVAVESGYAVDSLGREIVLSQKKVLPVPPVSDDGFGNPVKYDLTINYPKDDVLEETETRSGICLPRDAVRLSEEPVFCWVKLDINLQPQDESLKNEIKDGLKIIVTRVEIYNCKINKDLSIAQRRNARPATRPFIYAGKTNIDSTEWEVEERIKEANGSTGDTVLLLLKTTVDTSEAQFEIVPHYSARIEGERVVESNQQFGYIIEGFVYVIVPIDDTTNKQLTSRIDIYLLLPSFALFSRAKDINPPEFLSKEISEINKKFKELKWHIVWMGIEE